MYSIFSYLQITINFLVKESLRTSMRLLEGDNRSTRDRLDTFESKLGRVVELQEKLDQQSQPSQNLNHDPSADGKSSTMKEQMFDLQLKNHKLEAELGAMQIRLKTYEQMQTLTDLLKDSQKYTFFFTSI